MDNFTAKEILTGSLLPFEEWITKVSEHISEMEEHLKEKISDDPAILCEQLSSIEVYCHTISNIYVQAQYYLTTKKKEVIKPKCEEKSSEEQKTHLKFDCRNEQRLVDLLGLYVSKDGLIGTRISAIQSMLKTENMLYKGGADPSHRPGNRIFGKPPF
jgi:hypothetical protein